MIDEEAIEIIDDYITAWKYGDMTAGETMDAIEMIVEICKG